MTRALRTLVIVVAAIAASAAVQPRQGDMAAVLARVGEWVQQYYGRAQTIVSVERVDLQNVNADLVSDGSRSRRLVYELRVAWEPPLSRDDPPDAQVLREVLTINGRPPRPGDKPGCMDPAPVSPEPLAMLLPSRQQQYAFTWVRTGRMDRRAVVVLDYKSVVAEPETITWRDECVTIELPGRTRGRVWADAATGEILRFDEQLMGMFEFRVPSELTRPGGATSMTIERADMSIRYKQVLFRNPDEALMLPASIDTLTVIRNAGVPRVRKRQVFSNYRRFVTEGRVVR